jgi:hypothetical protein
LVGRLSSNAIFLVLNTIQMRGYFCRSTNIATATTPNTGDLAAAVLPHGATGSAGPEFRRM